MAITSGFFNSLNGDRLYNSETFNTYFEGLISSNGIFKGVDDEFNIAATTGLTLNVGRGKALVNNHWVRSTATETVNVSAAHNLLKRYDMITLKWSNATRTVSIGYTEGTPASTPHRPSPKRTSTDYEIVLAYVLVNPNVTTLTMANIYDMRANTELCGYITGLIDQVDVTELYAQYEARFTELESAMVNWQAQQQAQFTAWYEALTEQLNVNTYIEEYTQSAEGALTTLTLNSDYATTDTLMVLLNNIVLVKGVDYTLSGNVITFTNGVRAGNTVTCRWLKSRIGYN